MTQQKAKRTLVFPSMGVIAAFILLVIIFSILSKEFFTLSTAAGILTIAAELGTVTLAVALLMISGEFDLSVGAVYAWAGVLLARLLSGHLNGIASLAIVFVFALIIGLVNGFITTKIKIPSFITTLGMMMALRGFLLIFTAGFPVAFKGESLLISFLNGRLPYGFRVASLWFLFFLLLFSFILNRTKHGNWSLATGGNPDVARTLGVKIERVKMLNFLLTALFAALAGCFSFGRFKMAYPTLGTGLELEAIASAVLGGCYLAGGYGTIVGAFFGALVISSLRVGLVLIGAPAYWYQAFIGVILVLGMIINKEIMKKVLQA
ncbi:ABC transporter permease [Candidatus Bipolaricaulota sp. J31]